MKTLIEEEIVRLNTLYCNKVLNEENRYRCQSDLNYFISRHLGEEYYCTIKIVGKDFVVVCSPALNTLMEA